MKTDKYVNTRITHNNRDIIDTNIAAILSQAQALSVSSNETVFLKLLQITVNTLQDCNKGQTLQML